jgi:hypothetical protein
MDINEFTIYAQNHTIKETAKHFKITVSKVSSLSRELNLPLKTSRYKNIDRGFSEKQIELLTGSLLGDGSLSVVGKHNRKSSKFQEIHSSTQYEFLEWKKQILSPFSNKVVSKEVTARKLIGGAVVPDLTKTLTSCELTTITHPFLTELESKWYLRDENNEYVLRNNRRIKRIPLDLHLTEFSLAVWFFDDGSNNPKNRQAAFNTQSYTKEECLFLVDKLKTFGITCGVVKNRDKPVIQTRACSYLNLINLALSYLPCESMRCKVDLSKYKPPNFSTRFQKRTTYQVECSNTNDPQNLTNS